MAKKLPEGQGARKSALWVDAFHHTCVQMCARVMRTPEGDKLSSGQFVELAIEKLIEGEPTLETLRPVLAEMKKAYQAAESVTSKEEAGSEG